MTRVGYVWVGPLEHSSDYQRSLIAPRELDEVFEDISPNTTAAPRLRLSDALDRLGHGDTLVVWRLDRLGSTSSAILSLLELLGRRGVTVESVAEGLDTAGPTGAGLLEAISLIQELERTLNRERTLVGVYAARARGRAAGRPKALSSTNVERARMLREQGASVREIAEELGTSRATIYRALEPDDLDLAASEDRQVFTVRLPGTGDSGQRAAEG